MASPKSLLRLSPIRPFSIIITAYLIYAPSVSLACGAADSVYTGSICSTAANFCPRGYAIADGAILSISENQALFSLLGNTFGGDGRSTFGLPDLRGRTLVGAGRGPGLSQVLWGQQRGVENVTQSVDQMPAHTHVAQSSGDPVAVSLSAKQVSGQNTPSEGAWLGAGGTGPKSADIYVPAGTAGATVELGGVTVSGGGQGPIVIGTTGNSQSTINIPPQLGITYCIATEGLYPPRN